MAVSENPKVRSDRYVTKEAWETATFARRMNAWLIDLAMLLAAILVIANVLGLTAARQLTGMAPDGSTIYSTVYYVPAQWYGSLLALASALYVIPQWRLTRSTLGERLLGLEVVHVEERALLDWPHAAIRWLVLFGWTFTVIGSAISALAWVFVLLFVAWLGVLIVTTWRNPQSQGIHDRLAQSLVQKRQVYTVLAPKAAAGPSVPQEADSAPATGLTRVSRGLRRSTRKRPAKD